MSTKFASTASVRSLPLRSGVTISRTVRLKPTASMLDTTKVSMAMGTALAKASKRFLQESTQLLSTAYVGCPRYIALHPRQVSPEVRQAIRAAEQRRENRRIGHH